MREKKRNKKKRGGEGFFISPPFFVYSYVSDRLMEFSELKARIFTLLREDEEFRYAVAGMLGLEGILSRLEKHDERFEEILQRLDRHEAELVKLRENMIAEFKRHDEEIAKLREDFNRMLRVIGEVRESQSRLERRIDSSEGD